jgi:hypothetical protein
VSFPGGAINTPNRGDQFLRDNQESRSSIIIAFVNVIGNNIIVLFTILLYYYFMSERINDKCANCPKLKSLGETIKSAESIIQIADDFTENYEKLEIDTLAELYGVATTELINTAVATNDKKLIELARVYTEPLVKVLQRYINGLPVSAKEIVEAAALGMLDAKQAGIVDNPELKEFFKELDNFYNIKDATEKALENVSQSRTALEESNTTDKANIAALQQDCPGAKRNILLLGKYTCQSPNK